MPDPDLRLIRAPNPSALTGTGTNTYLLGRGQVAVIDPGPDMDTHLAALLDATQGEEITDILVTHAHLDHSALAPRLARLTGARVLAYGTAQSGRSAAMQVLADQGLTSDEGADPDFAPDQTLTDGQEVTVAGTLTLRALHLPGHMSCHLGFACGNVLFSGDHVMAWATTLVSPPDGDMTAYMASLHRLVPEGFSVFHPGHGTAVTDPASRLSDLIRHRLGREAAILAALRSHGPAAPATLAARIYTDIAPSLIPAATRNVLAHLIDLAARDLTHPDPGPLATTLFRAT